MAAAGPLSPCRRRARIERSAPFLFCGVCFLEAEKPRAGARARARARAGARAGAWRCAGSVLLAGLVGVGSRGTLQVRPCKLRHRIHAMEGPGYPPPPAPDSFLARQQKRLRNEAAMRLDLSCPGLASGFGIWDLGFGIWMLGWRLRVVSWLIHGLRPTFWRGRKRQCSCAFQGFCSGPKPPPHGRFPCARSHRHTAVTKTSFHSSVAGETGPYPATE
jgi:hypothetical protein